MSVAEIIREIEVLPLEERLKVLARLNELTENKAGPRPLWEVVAELGAVTPAEAWAQVPTDAAKNLDHYLYGRPTDPA